MLNISHLGKAMNYKHQGKRIKSKFTVLPIPFETNVGIIQNFATLQKQCKTCEIRSLIIS